MNLFPDTLNFSCLVRDWDIEHEDFFLKSVGVGSGIFSAANVFQQEDCTLILISVWKISRQDLQTAEHSGALRESV